MIVLGLRSVSSLHDVDFIDTGKVAGERQREKRERVYRSRTGKIVFSLFDQEKTDKPDQNSTYFPVIVFQTWSTYNSFREQYQGRRSF